MLKYHKLFTYTLSALALGVALLAPGVSYATSPLTLSQVEVAITRYGKQPLIALVLARNSRQITLQVGQNFRPFLGAPDPAYVTAQTLQRDLQQLGLSMQELDSALQAQATPPAQTSPAPPVVQPPKRIETVQSTPQTTVPSVQTQPHADVVQTPQSMEGWDGVCQSMGKMAFSMAGARDRGAPLSEVLRVGLPHFSRLGPAGENLLRTIAVQIFASRWWTPSRAQQETELQCEKSRPKMSTTLY